MNQTDNMQLVDSTGVEPHTIAPKPKKIKLTRKQKAFADELLNDKTITLTEAAKRTYNVTTQGSAALVGTDTFNKPIVQAYLNEHDYAAQATIAEMMLQRDDKRLAFDAAKDIQDRVHGRATQRVEQTTTGVTLTIDLTSSLAAQT